MALEKLHVVTIGIDLGGTNLRIAAYTPDIGILHSIALPTRLEAGPQAVVDDMCGAILQLLDQYSEGRKLAGIGVGSPGPLELPRWTSSSSAQSSWMGRISPACRNGKAPAHAGCS